jgi:hypothetical protein
MIDLSILEKGTKVYIVEDFELKVRFITDIAININSTPMIRYKLSVLNSTTGSYYDQNIVFDNLETLKKTINNKIDTLTKLEKDAKKEEKT